MDERKDQEPWEGGASMRFVEGFHAWLSVETHAITPTLENSSNQDTMNARLCPFTSFASD